MRGDTSSRPGGFQIPDKNALWTVVFAILAVLCVVLIFVVDNWWWRILFLLVALGAGAYCWLMVMDRRARPRAAQAPAQTPDAPQAREEAPAGAAGDAPEMKNTEKVPAEAAAAEEAPVMPKPVEDAVYVSEKGDKYHRDRGCAGLRFADDVETVSRKDAAARGRKPCSKCAGEDGEKGQA